jgi:hypothetical protein
MAFHHSTFVLGHSVFALLLVAFLQFPSSAKAQALVNAGSSTPTTGREHAMAIGVDGLDCITSYDVVEEPAQVCDNSPNPWNDLDEICLSTDDKAVIPTRSTKETPQTTGTTVDTIALRRPGIVPAFLFSTHSSDSLHEHIRERAPPTLA